MFPMMLGYSLFPNYLSQTFTIFLVLLIVHFQLMYLESRFPISYNKMKEILQFEDFLCNFQVFSLDPLLFQFSGTQMQALGTVFRVELCRGMTLW